MDDELRKSFTEHEVSLLIEMKGVEKSFAVLKIACEMLLMGNFEQVVFLRKCTGFNSRCITLKYSGNKPYFPEFDKIYKFLKESIGDEAFQERVGSDSIVISSMDHWKGPIRKNSAIILDQIEEMDMTVVKEYITHKWVSNKVIMTYGSENVAFTELMIQELDQTTRMSKSGSLCVINMSDETGAKVHELTHDELLDLLTVPFERSDVSDLTIPVNIKGREILLNFSLNNDALTLRNPEVIPGYAGTKRLTAMRVRGENVIRLVPAAKEPPPTSVSTEAQVEKVILPDLISCKDTQEAVEKKAAVAKDEPKDEPKEVEEHFWVKGSSIAAISFKNEGTDSYVSQDAQDSMLSNVIELVEVNSPFWGKYKTHVMKQVLKSTEEEASKTVGAVSASEMSSESKKTVLSMDSKKKYIVGKIAGSDLRGKNQSWIVRTGEIITEESIEKAAEAGVLIELIINMTLPGMDG